MMMSSGAPNALSSVREQIESSLRNANVAAEDMEEIAAIITTTTRSLERRLQRDGQPVDANAAQTLVSMLKQRCVDDEGLVDEGTWGSVASSVAIGAAGGAAGFDAVTEVQRLEEAAQRGLVAVSLPEDVKEESAAIITIVCRGLSRRISRGAVVLGSAAEVQSVVHAEISDRLVTQEALLSPQDLQAVLASSAPAAAPPMPTGAAPPQLKPEVMMELRTLFPTKSIAELEAAAIAGGDLEGAVFQVLSAAGPAGEAAAPPAPAAPAANPNALEEDAGARPRAAGYSLEEATEKAMAAAAAPVASASVAVSGDIKSITTFPVTTGACSFGLCFDVTAKDRPVTVTGLKSASSPGLNWGKGGEVKIQIFTTEGASRGRELQPELWTKIGQSDGLQLPLVSWVDTEPEYGQLPLSTPVTVPAGQRHGFLVHTSDLYGIVHSVGVGAGGEMDFLDDEDGPQPFKAGQIVSENEDLAVVCGNAMGAQIFQEFDGVSMPQPGGFVGIVEYTVG